MSEDVMVGSKNGLRNHYLSKSPKSTRCGQFAPDGFPEPNENKPLCQKCEDSSPRQNTRPLPDTMRGNRRGE